jgi:ketosteroid isomerase-like protein
MTPVEVLHRWYDAHRDGDMEAARAVLADDCVIELPDRELIGFDAFLAWSRERAAREGPDFSMAVVDVMPGTDHVAALLDLRKGARRWRQVAVYTVRDARIVSIWTAESERPFDT